MRSLILALGLLVAPPALAQGVAAGVPIDTSSLATKSDVAAAQAAATAAQQAAANACQPMAAIPPAEAVGGSTGSGTACRLVNAVQPRITRVRPWATDATGKASVTYQDIGTTDLGVVLTLARTSTTTITPTCGYDPATLTRTGVTIVCTVNLLNLGVLSISAAPAGVAGSVTVLPNTPAS